MALSLDRQTFIDIISEGQGDIGGVMQPPPEGLWGMPRSITYADRDCDRKMALLRATVTNCAARSAEQ
jgi:hypothetical protein